MSILQNPRASLRGAGIMAAAALALLGPSGVAAAQPALDAPGQAADNIVLSQGAVPGATSTLRSSDPADGADDQADTGADDQADPGADDQADTGADDQADPGADDQADPGADDQADPGADDQADPGADDQADPGMGDQVDENGHPVDENGNLVDENGHLVDAEDRLIDQNGHLVDAQDRLIDENGNLVDEAGNLVDENGDPIVVLVDDNVPLGETVGRGECTDWALSRRPDLANLVNGNAQEWTDEAEAAGRPVSKEPSEGALMVLQGGVMGAGGATGHVAVVESVQRDANGNPTSFTISEQNWNGNRFGTSRTINVSDLPADGSGVDFIG